MTNLKHFWPKDAFDAINIKAGECKLKIQGVDDEQISLEGDVDERRFRGFRQEETGHWLKLFFPHDHNTELTLKLPKVKDWVITVLSGKADIDVKDLRSRLQIMAGRGDIHIEEQTGRLTVATGQANIRLKHFVEANMPEIPPQEAEPVADTPRAPWDWIHWGEEEWENWGTNLGEKIGWWALDFSRYFDCSNIDIQKAGIAVQTGNGDIDMAGLDARTGLIRLSSGNLKIQEAYVQKLDLSVSHGNIDGKSLTPKGDWNVKTSHGNIRLSLAANVKARLDMSTRNGNIHSETPLVRVTHQGPETYYGKRMVGTIGPTDAGNLPELRIVALHGNIDLDSRSPESSPTVDIPEPETVTASAETNTHGDRPDVAETITEPEKDLADKTTIENTPQAVLEALRNGRISITEAEQLLKSMSL